jgi:hypothetical protein
MNCGQSDAQRISHRRLDIFECVSIRWRWSLDERHRVVDEHACSKADGSPDGEGRSDKPVGFPASSRTMRPPSTTSGRLVKLERIALDTQSACSSTRKSAIERPRKRGSRSKSSYTGLDSENELEAQQYKCTHRSRKLSTWPVGLVPTVAKDPASRIMKYIRMGKDVLLDDK